jgi:integrase
MVRGRLNRRSFSTLEEAQYFLAMLLQDTEDQRAVDAARTSGAVTIMELVRLWWLGPLIDGEQRGGHRQRVTGQTQRNYQYYIDAYISRIGNQSALAYARNPSLLKLFYDSLPNRCAWHVHGVLRMVFKEAVTRGLVDRNPCMAEKPARRKRRKRQIPSRPEVDKIVSAAEEQDRRWGLFNYVTSTLGTRCGETVALRAEDFAEANHVVHIERAVSKTSGRPTLKEPKKGEPRDLPIDDPEFWDYVRPFLQEPGFLFPGFYRDGPRVGPAAEPKPWHPDHAEKRFKTMVRGLGLPELTLHSLRHFVATQLLIEGQPINQVAEFLGHTPQMTLMLYGRHLDLEAMRRVGRAATGLVKRPPAHTSDSQPALATLPTARAKAIDPSVADETVLDLAKRGPITNSRVRTATGLTRRQTSKALNRLVRDGRITRRGTKRGTEYVLKLG